MASPRRRVPTELTVAGVIAVSLAMFYFVAQSWGKALVTSTDLLFIAASGVCAVLGFLVVWKWGFRGKFGTVYLGLFLGTTLWFLGETVWGVYEIVLHVSVPYPSIADVFYLAGYVPIFLGIAQFLRFFGKRFTLRRLTVALTLGIAICIGSGTVLTFPLMTKSPDILTKLFDVTYPFLDAALLVLALTVFLIFEKGKFARAWLWFALGLLLGGLAHLSFSYGTLMGWYYSGHPIELLWLWSFVCLGLGFTYQARDLAG